MFVIKLTCKSWAGASGLLSQFHTHLSEPFSFTSCLGPWGPSRAAGGVAGPMGSIQPTSSPPGCISFCTELAEDSRQIAGSEDAVKLVLLLSSGLAANRTVTQSHQAELFLRGF